MARPPKQAPKRSPSNPFFFALVVTMVVSVLCNVRTSKWQKTMLRERTNGEAYPGYYDHPDRRMPFAQWRDSASGVVHYNDDNIDDNYNGVDHNHDDDDNYGDSSETSVDDEEDGIRNFEKFNDNDDENVDNLDVDVDAEIGEIDEISENDDNENDNDDDNGDDNDDDDDNGDDTNNDGDDNDTVATDNKVTVKTRTAVDDRKPSLTTETPSSITKPGTDTYIRSWGCDLTETPLIFVHVGKSGGGSIRARLAASALNYDRKKWNEPHKDGHYYPILQDNNTTRIGKFCNSHYPHYVLTPHTGKPPLMTKSFEGDRPCNATTPLGIAVACPHAYKDMIGGGKRGAIYLDHYRSKACARCDDDYYLETDYYFNDGDHQKQKGWRNQNAATQPTTKTTPPLPESVFDPSRDPPPESTCDIVLAAHTNLGAELNYLPPRYLKEHWWDKSEFAKGTQSQPLEKYWDILLNDRKVRREKLKQKARGLEPVPDDHEPSATRWCPSGYQSAIDGTLQYDRPASTQDYKKIYERCGAPLASQIDGAFLDAFSDTKNYSPFYASMPLHRVTMLRDPWSWAISKFFWHNIDDHIPVKEDGTPRCLDYMAPVSNRGNGEPNPFDPITGRPMGWIEQFAVMFLHMLCGNDCRIRWENGMMSLEELEDQTASNLRNAFSVVGILEEEHSFFDMVTDRIRYVDLSRNLHVKGGTHATKKTDENLACKALFGTNETFREAVRRDAPSFAALERVYHIGVEVNRFQKVEIKQCKLAKGEQPTEANYTPPGTKAKPAVA